MADENPYADSYGPALPPGVRQGADGLLYRDVGTGYVQVTLEQLQEEQRYNDEMAAKFPQEGGRRSGIFGLLDKFKPANLVDVFTPDSLNPKDIYKTLANVAGSPEAILTGLKGGLSGDVSWNPYHGQERSVWDIGAGGDYLSQDQTARDIGRTVGTIAAIIGAGSAMGGEAGAGEIGAGEAGAGEIGTEGIAQLPSDPFGPTRLPVENLPSIPSAPPINIPPIPPIPTGGISQLPPASSMPDAPPPVENLPSDPGISEVPPISIPDVPNVPNVPVMGADFPYQNLLKSALKNYASGGGGGGGGGGSGMNLALLAGNTAQQLRKQPEPLPKMFDPNYRPKTGAIL